MSRRKDFPLPPIEPRGDESEGKLDEYESKFIFDKCLKKANRYDESVLRFIEAFVRCKSISQASYEAGIHHTLGYRIRHKRDVARAIQELIEKSAIKYGFDSSEVFERVKEVVDFDPIMLQNADGSFKSNLHDIPAEYRRVIKKLKVKNIYNQIEDMNGMKEKIIVGEVIEYEFYDKLKASELVGREKEMFKNTTKVEHSVTKDMANILLESANRAKERDRNVIEVKPDNVS